MKRIKRWWPVLAAVALALGAFAILRPDPIPVETALVTRAPMRVTVDEEGRTRVRDRYIVTAPVAGRLERMNLREGARIEAGQVVARLAALPLDAPARQQAEARLAAARAQVQRAEAAVAQTRATLDNARQTLERRRKLVALGGIAPETIERFELEVALRESELNGAQATVTVAKAEAEAADAALLVLAPASATSIAVRAPAAGRVLRLHDASARVVAAGTPLLELGETAAIEVIVPVLSADAVRINPDDCVSIDEWGGATSLEGRVRLIEPSGTTRVSALGIEEQRVNVIIDLLHAPPSLGDGYRVEVGITVWENQAALQVPASAVARVAERWIAFTVQDGRAVQRELQIGQRNGAVVEVLAGLEPGEQVILFPSDRIVDGVRVRAPQLKPPQNAAGDAGR